MIMNRLSSKVTEPVFYALSFTWGFLYTFAGLITALLMLITGHRPRKWGWCWYFETGKKNWGGAERGFIFLKDRSPANERLMNHEFGHAIQNCIFGPLMLPLVTLPSTIRYWARRIQTKRGKSPRTAYDDIWFEGQATRIGTAKMKQLTK